VTRRIVVLRSGALGDVVLTLPAIHVLRRDYPHASIEALGRPEIWRVAGSMVDAVARIEAPMFAGLFSGTLSPELRDWLEGVDLAVAWTVQDPRPVLEMAAVPHVVYACPYPPPGVHSTAWLLSTLPAERDSDLWWAAGRAPTRGCPYSRIRTLVAPSPSPPLPKFGRGGWGVRGQTWRLLLTEKERRCGHDVLTRLGVAQPIIIHPGAGSHRKRWPADRFAALGAALMQRGHQVVLIEGPADAEVVAKVQEHVGSRFPVLRDLDTRRLAAALAEARCFVGNDSGVTHLAGAVGAPTLALFGPTDHASWAPLGNARVLRRCRTQAVWQGQIMVCDDPGCMEAISIGDVLSALASLGC
jgi:heptosyltransferase III